MATRTHKSVTVTALPHQWRACSTHRWWWSRAEAKRAVRDHLDRFAEDGQCERCARGGRITWWECKIARTRKHLHIGHTMDVAEVG